MKNIPFSTFEIMHNEIEKEIECKFHEVYKSNWFISGKEVNKFEENFATYCGAKYAIGCGNGLDALHMLLRAYDIGEGDEVIIPSNTFIATALAVIYSGAKPILVESNISTFNICPENIEKSINANTKAIIAVHLYGRCADMDKINDIAKKHGLIVLEDAAQAHGATYKGVKAGNLGDGAAFSFYPGKNLGALGDGGAVVINDEKMANKVRMLGNYGSVVKYQHDLQGFNSRLDEIQSAFLNIKLNYLDKWNEYREEVANWYLQYINNIEIELPEASNNEYGNVWHIFSIRHKRRDLLKNYLENKGINTLIHYPKPIHKQIAFSEMNNETYPIAEEISMTQLSLPIYYGIKKEEVQYICKCLNEFK